jgi:hypothetical protein
MESGDIKSGDWKPRYSKLVMRVTLVLVTFFALSMGAWADDEESTSGDGPTPDVARVSLIHGDVSMQRGDSGDWTVATLNTPLMRGDQVATGDKSRAEVQLDYANVLRLASSSQASIADLTRTRIQIRLANGYAGYSVFKGSEADVEIDTPNVAVRPLKKGRYRVQVNSEEETEVIVRDGEAEISTPDGSVTVKEGRMVTVRGNAEQAEYRESDAPKGDDWDHFNKDRDSVIRDAESWHRTNAYYTGSHDLDGYGHWVFVPPYGWVWQPYQDAGWAPYRAGRWVWEPYWGWTWVSYEPWGWAPYHYGRWFYSGSGWVWYPGAVTAAYRPYWGPAFVTFIGFGHSSGFAFGFGNFGWVPVGPHDYYYPWYGRGFRNVNVVNITNVVNVRNTYVVHPLIVNGRGPHYSNVDLAMRDPHWRNGISGMPVDQFGRGNTKIARLEVHDDDLRQARVVRGNIPVVPTRESLHSGEVRGVPASVRTNEGRYFEKRQPPAGFGRFDQQREHVESSIAPHVKEGTIPGSRNDRSYGSPMGDRGNVGRDVNRANDREDSNGRIGGPQNNRGNLGGQSGPPDSRGTPMNDRNGRLSVPNNGQNGGNVPDRGGSGRDAQRMGGDEKEAQKQPPTPAQNNSGANPGDRGNNSDRSGWSRFGGRGSRGDNSGTSNNPNPGQPMGDRNGRSTVPNNGQNPGNVPDRGNVGRDTQRMGDGESGNAHNPQQGSSPNPSNSGASDRSWSKFGGGRNRGNDNSGSPASGSGSVTPNSGGSPRNDSNPRYDRGNSSGPKASNAPSNNDGGFRRMPSSGERPSDTGRSPSPDRTDNSRSRADRGPDVSKPPLELNKPIVHEPRSTPSPRNDSSPRSEPRYTPTSGGGGSHGDHASSGSGSHGDRGSSGGGGGGNHGGGNSGGNNNNKGGGGDKGGGHDHR